MLLASWEVSGFNVARRSPTSHIAAAKGEEEKEKEEKAGVEEEEEEAESTEQSMETRPPYLQGSPSRDRSLSNLASLKGEVGVSVLLVVFLEEWRDKPGATDVLYKVTSSTS